MRNKNCEIDENGTKRWFQNRKFEKLHRTDGPAIVRPNGTREWWLNGVRHRTDGPAIEYPDGTKYWYVNGHQYNNLIDFCQAANMTPEETTLFLLK